MRIDAHHHLWDLGAVSYPWLEEKGVSRFFGDPSPIQRNYLLNEFRSDAAGVSGSVHIQVGAADPMAEARWVQSVADAAPDWTMAQVPFCDLTRTDLGDVLDQLQALPTVRGVRQIVGRAAEEDAATGTNDLLGDPAFAEGLRELGRRGLSFDLQLTEPLYEAMARVLDAAPDTAVALCHCGSPQDRTSAGHKAWDDNLRQLSGIETVTCKTSGLGMFDHDWTVDSIRPFVETCLEHFGPDRTMFGSNFPVDSLYSDYAKLLNAYEAIVPDAFKDAIFGGTARAFYSLS